MLTYVLSLYAAIAAVCISGQIQADHFSLRQEPSGESSLRNLEDVIKTEEQIRDFCYKHYNCNANNCNGKSENPAKKTLYSSCAELKNAGETQTGIYEIEIDTGMDLKKMKVFCDMETDGGGWLVIQRRDGFDEHVDFHRLKEDYIAGFGNLSTEFWLGNENIRILTNHEDVVLRVDLENFNLDRRFAVYDNFKVQTAEYVLQISDYYGDAGDGLSNIDGQSFSLYHYLYKNNTYQALYGGWWGYDNLKSFLNGEYLEGRYEGIPRGIWWEPWLGRSYSLKATEMKIKPKRFMTSSSESTATTPYYYRTPTEGYAIE